MNLQASPMSPTPQQEKAPTVSSQLFLYLMAVLEGRPMLPALRKLTAWIQDTNTAMDFLSILPVLCSNSVEAVVLYGWGVGNTTFGNVCLPHMSQKLGSLKSLIVKSGSKDAGSDLFDAILQLTGLETLQLQLPSTPLKPKTLLKMAQAFTNLTTLYLDTHLPHHQATDDSTQPGAADSSVLRQLESVTVTSRLHDRVCPCIPQFILRKTTRFVWWLPNQTTLRTVEDFTAVVDSLSSIQTLRAVQISSAKSSWMTAASCQPFFSQLSLQDCHIDIPLRSEEPPLRSLIQQASSQGTTNPQWDRLKGLHLIHARNRSGGIREDDGITLECLNYISQDIASLEKFSGVLRPTFTIETPNRTALVEWLAVLRGGPQSSSALHTLTVYDTRNPSLGTTFEEASNLAQILDLLFPRLEVIRPYQDDTAPAYWSQRWAFIQHLHKTYKAERLLATL